MKKYYHLDSTVQGIPMGAGTDGAGECWRLCSGGYDAMTVLGSRPFETVSCVMSKQYSQKEKNTCLVREAEFTDRITDRIYSFGEGMEAERTQVFQYGSGRSKTEEQVATVSFCLSPDKSWDFLVWNRETWQGGKIHDCRGVPVYAKTAAIHTMSGSATLYRSRI